MHNQVMIDLETMSLSKNAAIISIGAVRFNGDNGTLGDTFYRVVNLKSSQRAGGEIEATTVMWWMQQSDAARLALAGDDGILIEPALKEFNEWIRKESTIGIWGNGADFDNVVLENTYHRLSWTPPWTYKMNRCYRTVAALNPYLPRTQEGTYHHALDDAISQAKHLCILLKK